MTGGCPECEEPGPVECVGADDGERALPGGLALLTAG
jgi:hypothetical protein